MPLKKVLETIKRENLIESGDKVLVAFSGGADSAALLHILKELESELGISVFAAHFNHQIRNVDAHKDALFAYRMSKQWGIPCFLKSVNIPELAKEKNLTMEEAARVGRYEFFFEIKERLNIDKIAIAHNLDDQAETVLMRIMRGTGLNGLTGISYKREDGVVRPLMDVKRYEIEEYCKVNDVEYRTDATNFQSCYTRNKIRLELLPFIEDDFACNIKEILSRMSNGIREDSLFLENISDNFYKKSHRKVEDYAIEFDLETFSGYDVAIQKRLLRSAYTELTKSHDGLESVHLDEAIKILRNPKKDVMTNFPKGIIVTKKGYNLYVTQKPIVYENIDFEYVIDSEKITCIDEIGYTVEAEIMSKERCKTLLSGTNIKAFDLDKIKGNIVVRNRRTGDKIKPVGFGGTKKIKDIFIDKKIPFSQRGNIPIFADDEKIIWVFGHEISEESKIDETTTQVVRLTVKQNKN